METINEFVVGYRPSTAFVEASMMIWEYVIVRLQESRRAVSNLKTKANGKKAGTSFMIVVPKRLFGQASCLNADQASRENH